MSKPQRGDEEKLKAQFTEDNYRDWLSQFSKRQTVGYSYNTDERPLARFMTEQTGHKAIVMPVRTSIGNCHFINPEWARPYIHEIDKCEPERIMKVRALRILENTNWEYGDRLD